MTTLEYIETDDETQARIEYLDETARDIRRMVTERKQIFWDIGDKLLKAKQSYPGVWHEWSKTQLPFSHDTATRLMRYAENMPRPLSSEHELPRLAAYALSKAPKQVQADAIALDVKNEAAVKLLTTAYRNRDETDEYAEMVASGGIDTQDGFIPFSAVTPAYVREYRKEKQAARFITYTDYGTVKSEGSTYIIEFEDIPSIGDLVDKRVKVELSWEIEQ